jgi:hypothetical protein
MLSTRARSHPSTSAPPHTLLRPSARGPPRPRQDTAHGPLRQPMSIAKRIANARHRNAQRPHTTGARGKLSRSIGGYLYDKSLILQADLSIDASTAAGRGTLCGTLAVRYTGCLPLYSSCNVKDLATRLIGLATWWQRRYETRPPRKTGGGGGVGGRQRPRRLRLPTPPRARSVWKRDYPGTGGYTRGASGLLHLQRRGERSATQCGEACSALTAGGGLW